MTWGKPNAHWIRSREVEALSESGCYLCFAFEKLVSGNEGTFILQHHSPDFKCECQYYPAATRVAQHDLAVTCESHKAMMEYILILYNEFSEKMIAAGVYNRTYPAHGVELCRSQDGVPTITILDYKCRGRKAYEFILRKPPNSGASSEETTIDASWIDLSHVIRWKHNCIDRLGTQCRESDKSILIAPDWLIDTTDNCIVRGESSMHFVALSYRWGTSVSSRVGLDKLDELRKPGSLFDSFITKVPIIRDAIHVVQNIKERYLWIDAVCIIHDDKAHLAHQLQHMGAIYASASLTIISTDGDGMAGLPGLQGCSSPRKLEGIFPWTENREIFVRDLPSLNHIFVPEYYKRGWTFQEYILSHRRLIFGNQQIHWTCHCGTWHEDLPNLRSPMDEANETVLQSSKILRRRPDFNVLGNLLRSYNNLGMTYPEDALPGIAGLLKLISPSFEGGFLFGMPVMCFEAALLWGSRFWYYNMAGAKYSGLQRREHSSSSHSLLPNAELPSWSWVGWKSDYLSILKDEEDYQVVTYPNQPQEAFSRSEKWITLPTAIWYCQDTPTSTTRHRIKSSWSKPYIEPLDDRWLPDGWTREKYPGTNGPDIANTPSVPFGIAGTYVYSHPEFPNRLFWRPFSVYAGREARQMKQRRFLSCTTKRAFFPCLRKTGCTMEAGAMDYHLELVDDDDQVCGWIQLPTADAALPSLSREASPDIKVEPEYSPDIPSPPDSTSSELYELVELVVVCRRLFSESIDRDRRQWLDRRDYRPFYGVLCIAWENGVAYRKGYGYVTSKAWDQHDVDRVDLVLG
ncbi:heterokaryon incompatibility domain-containing protein [Trichoderma velutinum]